MDQCKFIFSLNNKRRWSYLSVLQFLLLLTVEGAVIISAMIPPLFYSQV
ncbi:hypothetical protein MOA99_00845 [Bacillus haynesii]|nr:hypothetical protein [Bacillus haynesii]MCY7847204.1 hypothetical protein [Bacillus haynesii]